MGNNYQEIISALVGVIAGFLCHIIYCEIMKKRGNAIVTFREGYSIKFHYFVWFVLLPAWIVSGTYDYISYYKLFEGITPLQLMMDVEFLWAAVSVAAFVGFFKNKKYSWYCIIVSCALCIILNVAIDLYLYNYNHSYSVGDVGGMIGLLALRIPCIIYYSKRKELFNGASNFLNTVVDRNNYNAISYYQTNNLHNSDVNNVYNNIESAESVRFCRKCGTRLDSKSLFCRKCGTKISEEE